MIKTKSNYLFLKRSIVLLSFCEGLLRSHHLTFFFLYSEKYKISPLTYSLTETILSIIFALNPFFGYLADSKKFLKKLKKSYIILINIISTIGYLICSITFFYKLNYFFVFFIHFIIDMCFVFRTVLNDSLSVILKNRTKALEKNDRIDHSKNTVVLVYGAKWFGKVLSNIFFGLAYHHFHQRYFLFLAAVCVFTTVLGVFLKEDHWEPKKSSFREDVFVCIKAVRDNKLGFLLGANSVLRMAPVFMVVLEFFFKIKLNFKNDDFALKYIFSDLFLFLGICSVNTVFNKISKSLFLKFSNFFYFFGLILMIYFLRNSGTVFGSYQTGGFVVYSSLLQALFDIFTFPIISIFMTICPEKLESFFMALFFFINNSCLVLGRFLSTFLIYLFKIESHDYKKIDEIIVTHIIFVVISICILFLSFIPDKKRDYPTLKYDFPKFQDSIMNANENKTDRKNSFEEKYLKNNENEKLSEDKEIFQNKKIEIVNNYKKEFNENIILKKIISEKKLQPFPKKQISENQLSDTDEERIFV